MGLIWRGGWGGGVGRGMAYVGKEKLALVFAELDVEPSVPALAPCRGLLAAPGRVMRRWPCIGRLGLPLHRLRPRLRG